MVFAYDMDAESWFPITTTTIASSLTLQFTSAFIARVADFGVVNLSDKAYCFDNMPDNSVYCQITQHLQLMICFEAGHCLVNFANDS